MEGQIVIGIIRTAWGVNGWLKLTSCSGEWNHFFSLKTLTIRHPRLRKETVVRVEKFQVRRDTGYIKLKEINTPEEGKALAGYEICVSRAMAAPLNESEWYWTDLIGLRLQDENGRDLGRIVNLVESADDLLVVEPDKGKQFFIPFRSNFVGQPNLEDGTLCLLASWLVERL